MRARLQAAIKVIDLCYHGIYRDLPMIAVMPEPAAVQAIIASQQGAAADCLLMPVITSYAHNNLTSRIYSHDRHQLYV